MDVEALFKSDPALYADMETYRRSGAWTVAYDSPTALWMRWDRGWLHAIAAFDPEEARDILQRIPEKDAIVLRGCAGLRETAEACGFSGCSPCRQVVYRGAPPPVRTALIIRRPDEADYQKVSSSYSLGSEAELRAAFDGGDFLGGYLDGELAGFIGVHDEGSMGMLHVFEPYRRRGFGEALYAALIDHQLERGRLPFAQIFADNTASLALQRKMGLTVSHDFVYWMWRGEDV